MPCIVQGIFILTQLVIDIGQVVIRNHVSRVSLLIKFERRDAFIQLARVGVVMRSDVQLLVLTGTVAQLEGLFAVLLRHLGLTQIAVNRPNAGIGHGEIGIQFHCPLIQR